MKAPALVTPCPSLFVTTTSTAPGEPAGVVAVICVDDTKVALVAATPPTVTPNDPPEVKFVPEIVIVVPPAVEPVDGEIPEIVGAAAAVPIDRPPLVAA